MICLCSIEDTLGTGSGLDAGLIAGTYFWNTTGGDGNVWWTFFQPGEDTISVDIKCVSWKLFGNSLDM